MNVGVDLKIYGHPRKGWDVESLDDLKVKPERGTFSVTTPNGEAFKIGPEPRPFEDLRAADFDELAKKVVERLYSS